VNRQRSLVFIALVFALLLLADLAGCTGKQAGRLTPSWSTRSSPGKRSETYHKQSPDTRHICVAATAMYLRVSNLERWVTEMAFG
jgi:hypothetical protein